MPWRQRCSLHRRVRHVGAHVFDCKHIRRVRGLRPFAFSDRLCGCIVAVLRKFRERLATPIAELDAQKLREFCAGQSECTPISALEARKPGTAAGEISSVRIVPHDGSPWLEATITDGTGTMIAMWTGRRRIAGIAPGKRLMVSGRMAPAGMSSRLMVYNPAYELL